jgi:hypothetical protein
VGLPSVIDDEDNRLRDGREEHDNCIHERTLELLVCTLSLILFGKVVQADVVEGIVVDSHEDDDLSEEGNAEPRVPDCMRGAHVRDTLEGSGIGEEVKVY